MPDNEERVVRQGTVYSFPCPKCGYKFEVMATLSFKILPGKRRRRRPEVCDALSQKEWQSFTRLTTGEKIIFGIGKFKDVKGSVPSMGDLEDFVSISRQTISEYTHQHPKLILVEGQKKDDKKRFEPVHLELTEMGLQAYQHITDSLLGE